MAVWLTSDPHHGAPSPLPSDPHGTVSSMMNVAKLLEGTPEAAYWVGFIFADGTTTGSRLRTVVAPRDAAHVERLAGFLGVKVGWDARGNAGFGYMGPEVTAFRDRFGLVDDKTHNPPRSLPYTDEELLRAFAVGLIDGDGNVKVLAGRRYCQVRTVSHLSWEPFYTMLSDRLQLGRVGRRGNGTGRIYTNWAITKHADVAKLAIWITASGIPAMNRKWSKVDLDYKPRALNDPELHQIVASMYEAGASQRAIADATGLSVVAVNGRAARYRKERDHGSLAHVG